MCTQVSGMQSAPSRYVHLFPSRLPQPVAEGAAEGLGQRPAGVGAGYVLAQVPHGQADCCASDFSPFSSLLPEKGLLGG
jgi:hypothetical protein